jgi:hypothetical protein
MMKKIICATALLALIGCTETPQSNTNIVQAGTSITKQSTTNKTAAPLALLTDYKTNAEKLITLIDNNGTDADIEKYSASLVAASKPIINSFIEKFPQCQEYLTALSQAADIIPTLPIAEIESGYHADGKLPKLTDASCYHAKDLLVHPATVQAMAIIGIEDAEQRKQAKAEIVEVISHFSQVEQAYRS